MLKHLQDTQQGKFRVQRLKMQVFPQGNFKTWVLVKGINI